LTVTLWAFAVLGVVGALKKLLIFGLPDVQGAIDRVSTFLEWLRRRWRHFRGD
jgi:hypothetical protein